MISLRSLDAGHPAKHLFGLPRTGRSAGPASPHPNRFSSPVVKRHGTVQKHTAVNPRAIHSILRTAAWSSSLNPGLQFFAGLPLGRTLQTHFRSVVMNRELKRAGGGRRAFPLAPPAVARPRFLPGRWRQVPIKSAGLLACPTPTGGRSGGANERGRWLVGASPLRIQLDCPGSLPPGPKLISGPAPAPGVRDRTRFCFAA